MFRRSLQLVVILLGISFISFFLLHISPGDPARIKLSQMGIPPSDELLEIERHKMGLDRPLPEQYFNWLSKAVQLDFGTSYHTGKPVIEAFTKHLKNTVKLALTGFLVALVISFPLGIYSAVKHNRFSDYIVRFFAVCSLSTPDFYLALIFMYYFGIRLKLMPIMGSKTPLHLVMPALVLGFTTSGKLIRQIRIAVLEELQKDYVDGVRSLGLPEHILLLRHVLKNAMMAIITILGVTCGWLLGGTAAIEVLFNYRGISSQVVTAISYRDLPMIQIYVLFMATTFTIINFLVDTSYVLFDPRVRRVKR